MSGEQTNAGVSFDRSADSEHPLREIVMSQLLAMFTSGNV